MRRAIRHPPHYARGATDRSVAVFPTACWTVALQIHHSVNSGSFFVPLLLRCSLPIVWQSIVNRPSTLGRQSSTYPSITNRPNGCDIIVVLSFGFACSSK